MGREKHDKWYIKTKEGTLPRARAILLQSGNVLWPSKLGYIEAEPGSDKFKFYIGSAVLGDDPRGTPEYEAQIADITAEQAKRARSIAPPE
jgi:hypothetical protein